MPNLTKPLLLTELAPHVPSQNVRLAEAIGEKALTLAKARLSGLPVADMLVFPLKFVVRLLAGEQAAMMEADSSIQSWLDARRSKEAELSGPLGELGLLALRASPLAGDQKPFPALTNLGYAPALDAELTARGADWFAADVRRRFLTSYAAAACGLDASSFEDRLLFLQESLGDKPENEFTKEDWQAAIQAFERMYQRHQAELPPEDTMAQLGALIEHLRSEGLPVCPWFLQPMIYGTLGPDSLAGRAATSELKGGNPRVEGEVLAQAMVTDFATSEHLKLPLRSQDGGKDQEELAPILAALTQELDELAPQLEAQGGWVQEFEFIVEAGKTWLLGFRPSPNLLPAAKLTLLVRLVEQGLLAKETAVMEADPSELEASLHPAIDPSAKLDLLATGLPASPGAAKGKLAFTVAEAEAKKLLGEAVILVRHETSPEDAAGMIAANGILTLRGGMTSHAAVVARGLGKPCVAGASGIRLDHEAGLLLVGDHEIGREDWITIDGTHGRVLLGEVALTPAKPSDNFSKLLDWANQIRRMKVRANAETDAEARVAREFGAEGIGLCRTEHMFLTSARIAVMREMILTEDPMARRAVLMQLLPEQKADFRQLYQIMAGYPITIRLLDPPLHEFLPSRKSDFAGVAEAMKITEEHLLQRLDELKEVNPMLGHRGCRLAITFPEILEMQARALLESAAEAKSDGVEVELEVMVPLVAMHRELEFVEEIFQKVANEVKAELGLLPSYKIGTMIELPRAALRADEIAEISDFFSFGTNDLTQTTYGISRDDATTFLRAYSQAGLLALDPFQTLDQTGVGELMQIAVERGRRSKPDLQLGICGEHGGDPASIDFCEQLGLDYVSCSPFRVPIAQLAAAQAFIRQNGGAP